MLTWKTAGVDLDLTRGAVVGVLNVTPDSFSDGGDFLEPETAVAAGLEMMAGGAALVDVGGESTRPGAPPVPAETELARVMPVVSALVGEGVPVSIDTSKPEVARRALGAGAIVINDVTGFGDPSMRAVAAESGAGVVVMHMQGEPRTMQDDPVYDDVVVEVRDFLTARAALLIEAGVERAAVVVDPGFGFGKTAAHNLELITRMGELVACGYPVMLGASRKSTLRAIAGIEDPRGRDGVSAVMNALAYERGARLFRVHDVVQTRDALSIAAAIVDSQIWEEWQQG